MTATRRVRVAYISPRDFLACFECRESGFPSLTDPGSVNQLRRVRLAGVPEGAAPVHAFFDHPRGAFGIVLEHPSFAPVPLNQEPPTIDCEITRFFRDGEGRTLAAPITDYAR